MSAIVTAVANEKGGVGKTSICLELATALALHAKAKVLALDADPQHGLIDWRADREQPPLFPVVGFASEKLHAEVRAHASNYDHILIDAPPRHMAILRAIILSAHCLLIPVTPSKHDLRSTRNFLETVKEAIAFNPDLKVAFIVNRRIPGTALGRDIFTALEEYPFPVLHAVIGQRVAFPEAHASGLSVLEEKHSGHSPAVAEIEALALELLEMLNHDEKDSLSKEAVRLA
jgi:chromosome partitioning protein